MRATQVRPWLFSLGMWLLGSLMVVDPVWAQGGVSFIARRDFGVAGGPLSLAVGDFNGDGQLDVATANIGGRNLVNGVSILLGQGDGTFQSAPDIGLGGAPGFIMVGDFNGDGRQDLATAISSGNSVSILLGNGDGSFQAAQDFGVGAGPQALTVGDFNGDGRLDLATANVNFDTGAGTVAILLAAAMAASRRPRTSGWAHFLGPSRWGTSTAMAGRIWPPPMAVPAPCRS
jgi:hypothetical protein